jgi:hypothetical protein
VDSSDNVYLTDANFSGTIYCFTSDSESLPVPKVLSTSSFMAVDRAGNIWQTNGHEFAAQSAGLSYRLSTPPGFDGDGGPLTEARFNGAGSIAAGPGGSIYANDRLIRRIRKISQSPAAVQVE